MVPCSSSIVKLGPHGGQEGRPWDDGGGYTGIRGLTVGHSHRYGVETLQVEYDLFGELVQGKKHGGGAETWEPKIETIRLDKFPEEFLTSVTGYHFGFNIMSLVFETNKKRKIGPFGRLYRSSRYYYGPREGEVSFQCSMGGRGAIVGFSGASGWYLDSIAFYVAVLCPADDFFHEMQKQGNVAYRTSPLCMARPFKNAQPG